MLDPARYNGTGQDSSLSLMADSPPSAQLIEQLLNIARASALEEMASGIAHELNQPLGAIATFSQAGERMLARPEPLLAGAIEVLQQINVAAMGAGEGLRRIRRLFNQDQGERVLHSLSDVLAELEPVLELLAGRSGTRLVVTHAANVPPVSIDQRQIQHVLFYTVQTAVIDNGSGIPAALRAEVFHPFFTTKTGGTGLGLASSRTVIESHQGTIGFDDAAGGGTRFWFRLPVANG
jgi:signal transduction histidine kinase